MTSGNSYLVSTLASALLAGHPPSMVARECGVEIEEEYHVLAIWMPSAAAAADPDSVLDENTRAQQLLGRMKAELSTRTAGAALSVLSMRGGTVLIPLSALAADMIERLVEQLSDAAGVAITAVVVSTRPEAISAAAKQVHELLTLAQRLGWNHGLYRFCDLAAEYQLRRPGPGREYLGSLLDPIDAYPELLHTLEQYVASGMNRQRTARLMHVHTNTVGYRLKKIGQLTEFDPTHPAGVWYLRAALIARA